MGSSPRPRRCRSARACSATTRWSCTGSGRSSCSPPPPSARPSPPNAEAAVQPQPSQSGSARERPGDRAAGGARRAGMLAPSRKAEQTPAVALVPGMKVRYLLQPEWGVGHLVRTLEDGGVAEVLFSGRAQTTLVSTRGNTLVAHVFASGDRVQTR